MAQFYYIIYPETHFSYCRTESLCFSQVFILAYPTFHPSLPISFITLRAHSYRANIWYFKRQLRVYLGIRDRGYVKNFLYFPFSRHVHKSYSSLKDRMNSSPSPQKNQLRQLWRSAFLVPQLYFFFLFSRV